LARKLGVERDVVFTGDVPFDEVADYYAQIDLFVVPRINERAARMVSPMKPFEAMAMNIPVLVADLPALVEIAGAGERAHMFRAEDPQSLATEVTVLMDAPEHIARLVHNAGRWVRQERAWSTVATAFGEAYDEVLAARRIPTGSRA
jgi:glycosyltransferase involved in cell wall biosynthesis